MIVDERYGLGENIYQRTVLREIKERVYLRTAWPQLYTDIDNVYCVRGKKSLRTQKKNIENQGANAWHTPTSVSTSVKISYSSRDLRKGSIIKALSKNFMIKRTGTDKRLKHNFLFSSNPFPLLLRGGVYFSTIHKGSS